jgi:hypothetical protein
MSVKDVVMSICYHFAANIDFNDNHRKAVHLILTTEFFLDSIDF